MMLRIHFGTRSESMKKQHHLELEIDEKYLIFDFVFHFLDMEVKLLENVRCWLI